MAKNILMILTSHSELGGTGEKQAIGLKSLQHLIIHLKIPVLMLL